MSVIFNHCLVALNGGFLAQLIGTDEIKVRLETNLKEGCSLGNLAYPHL